MQASSLLIKRVWLDRRGQAMKINLSMREGAKEPFIENLVFRKCFNSG